MKNIINLNGSWKFAPTYDQKPTNNHNVIETTVPLYTHKDLVRTGWQDVKVPGVWQRYAEKYSVFEGVCWFYREFEVRKVNSETFALLICKGINYKATIYINSKLVGVHESGYTEFSFDISEYLAEGVNSIAIEVDNRPTEVKWPNDWGYGVFGGIHRDIFIELYNGEAVYDIELTPDYDLNLKNGKLSFKAKGSASALQVKMGDNVCEIKNNNGNFEAELSYDNVLMWSPDSPELYNVCVYANNELYGEYNVGFRNVKCENGQFLLNGEPIELKGACYLCDSPKNGLAMDKEELEYDLIKMKEAGVNAVRTHYPMSDDFYALCDKLGFMVWIEPNIYCSKPDISETNTVFKRKDFVDVAVSMSMEMIKGARRFASVSIYGTGNECNTEHPESVEFFEKIADVMRALDNTRPLGYATVYGLVGKIAHTVDIIGINSYYGWYGVIYEDDLCIMNDERNGEMRVADVSGLHNLIERVEKECGEDKVLLLTEYGADSIPGFISSECELWSENYHAQVIEKYIEAAREHKSVAGEFVFAFTDYNDPSKPLNGRWNGFNLKGMMSYDRKIKLPYYSLQKMYKNK